MEARAKVGAKIAVWEQIAASSVSWDSTSLTCITEEAAAPASTSVQENVGSGDKDPLTGTGLGTISFCGYTSGTRHYAGEAGTTGIATISITGGDHITSGTPCAGTVSAQECDMIAIRTCLDSSKKDEARSVAPCTSGAFRFKPKKSLLGRPRRVLRERNDDSTGSDESIEVVDSQQNWADSAAPSSGDSYKSDASKKENPLTNENLHVEVHKHSTVTKGVESGGENILPNESTKSERNRKHEVLSEGPVQEFTREQISVSQPQSENNGKGSNTRITDYRAINLKPLDGLAELKEELQVLQMLSKQRKVTDNARPISRTDSQPKPGAVINPVDVHEKSAVDRPSSKILKSIEEHNVSEKETLPTEGGVSGREKISPKEPVSGAGLGNRPLIKDNAALNVSVNPLLCPTAKCNNSQEPCQQKDGSPVKSQPKAVEARPQSPRPPKALPESLTKGFPEEETNRNKADTVSRKSRENGHFVWVNNRRYQKLGKIGSGGSSDVFKVIAQDCTIYALKRIFLKGRDHQTACGFHQEIAYLERLRGKRHIIQLIDYEVTDKNIFQNNFAFHGEIQNDACIYMVLEYGEIDLARMLERKKREATEDGQLDENWLRLYWEHILKAVNTIHEERIVHADLKPANFLLVQGVLKLIDFGIAKAIQNDTTNIVREAQVGTLNYMSPEAFMMNSRDEHGTVKCGRASDIWSLGCILYQMVYGRTPFSHLNFYHKITEITNPKHEIEFPPIPNPLIMDIMRSCLVWDKRKRPRIPQLLEHPFLRPKVTELAINQQCLREVLLQSCKVYISVKGTLELTELMRKVVKGNSEGSSEHQLDEALLQLSRLYMQKAGKPALHELLTTLL